MKTWQAEVVVVAVLLAVTTITDFSAVSVVSALAVLASFCHAQIAERLRELEASRLVPSVECYPWLTRYWVVKEALWALVYITAGAWPALVGCAVFLGYPAWRNWYRTQRPLPRIPGDPANTPGMSLVGEAKGAPPLGELPPSSPHRPRTEAELVQGTRSTGVLDP